jgi:hypothetical protein
VLAAFAVPELDEIETAPTFTCVFAIAALRLDRRALSGPRKR